MSHTMTVEQAAQQLVEVLHTLREGDEIVLTEDGKPVGKIIPSPPVRQRRQPGSCKGMLVINQDDDSHLDDFKDYMP